MATSNLAISPGVVLAGLLEIDCLALHPLCQSRCCRLKVPLSADECASAVFADSLTASGWMARTDGGMCVHNENHRCGVYASRPQACRSYDCRADPRIWADFENRLPSGFTQA